MTLRVAEGRLAGEPARSWLAQLRRAPFTATLTILTVVVAPDGR